MTFPAAAALFVVLVAAKAWVFANIGWPLTLSAWFAAVWQDAAVALGFAALELAARGRRWIWVPYGVASAWIAFNVSVALILRSWLTWPMLHAARGTIADSVAAYLSPRYLTPIGGMLLVAAIVPLVLKRAASRAALTAAAILTTGLVFRAQTLSGFDRNAFTALLAMPRETAAPAAAGWRTSPFEAPGPSLARFRGSANGLNVLVVILESTAARYLGLYGARKDPMPRLSALGGAALVFDAAYATYPESVKGLYAFLCSRSPSRSVEMSAAVAARCDPLTKRMTAAGYRTGLFHAGRFAYLGMDAVVAAQQFDDAEDAGSIGGVIRSSFGVDEASTTARMLDWIKRSDRRFFAVYMPAAGHHPYASSVPPVFPGTSDFDRYRNAIHEADVALGRVVDDLRQAGRLDKTMIVVFGDHGEAFGQHDGNVGHALAIYDENVHVPLVIALPDIRETIRVRAAASVLDVAPTILDLAGLPGIAGEGQSLLDGDPRVAPFFADYSVFRAGLRDGCWKFHAEDNLLFDECVDPDERHNVAAEHPERVAAYRDRLRTWK